MPKTMQPPKKKPADRGREVQAIEQGRRRQVDAEEFMAGKKKSKAAKGQGRGDLQGGRQGQQGLFDPRRVQDDLRSSHHKGHKRTHRHRDGDKAAGKPADKTRPASRRQVRPLRVPCWRPEAVPRRSGTAGPEWHRPPQARGCPQSRATVVEKAPPPCDTRGDRSFGERERSRWFGREAVACSGSC